MERITKPDGKYTSPANIKLKAYEDTGLDPKDILNARDLVKIACALRKLNQYKELGDLDRLKELVEADKAGRCMFLPVAIGTPMYQITLSVCKWREADKCSSYCNGYGDCWEGEQIVKPVQFELWMLPGFGETVFYTRDEAEAAMEKMKEAAHD